MECGMWQKNLSALQICETTSLEGMEGKSADLSNFENEGRL